MAQLSGQFVEAQRVVRRLKKSHGTSSFLYVVLPRHRPVKSFRKRTKALCIASHRKVNGARQCLKYTPNMERTNFHSLHNTNANTSSHVRAHEEIRCKISDAVTGTRDMSAVVSFFGRSEEPALNEKRGNKTHGTRVLQL
jgi:hypothetical protein